MRSRVAWALLLVAYLVALVTALLTAGVTPALAQDESPRAVSCFENRTAAMRLNQLERAIAQCSQVIDDQATAAATRGQALSQRGLLRARRYVAIEVAQEAVQGIADITEGLRLHTPPEERRIQLLIVRAQLYVATGQTRRAATDYQTVLAADPNNSLARSRLRRLAPQESQ